MSESPKDVTPEEWRKAAEWCYVRKMSPYNSFWWNEAIKEIRKQKDKTCSEISVQELK